jgi:colanic acid/amylovoran biosynthesis protein
MKILITNTVTLNGGDFAILDALIKLLKQNYGQDTEFIVYDQHPLIAKKYYTEINYRLLLFNKHTSTVRQTSPFNRLLNLVSPQRRLLMAAKVFTMGIKALVNLMLTKEEREDFEIYQSADLIVSTGGTYLVENYLLDARFFDYKFTLALNKPLVLFTQSLGPYKKVDNIQAIKELFPQAKLILLRDEASYKNLQNIGVDVTNLRVCADVVFSDTSEEILEKAKSKVLSSEINVGISVRDWKFFKGMTQAVGQEKYFKSVAAICEFITQKLNGRVVFISTCQAIPEYHVDDSKTADKVYDLLSVSAKSRTSVNSSFHTPDMLKGIITQFDLVISTRMHVAIQSLNMGVPVLPIAYEFKTLELFKKIISEDLILDIDSIDEVSAVDTFNKFLKSLENTRTTIFEKVNQERLSALKSVDYLNDCVLEANKLI